MISLLVPTYRPGGIDMLAGSLKGQEGDFEVVIVDDHPGRVERGEAAKHIRDQGIPLAWYGTSRPANEKRKCGLANAVNTGLEHCSGEFVVMLGDYVRIPPSAFLLWKYVLDKHQKTLISGVAIMYAAAEPKAPGDVKTWTDDESPFVVPKWPWVPKEFETFYFGGPMAFFEAINGIDERVDHCNCWFNTSLVAQAKMLGYKLMVEDSGALTLHMVDHRVWGGNNDPYKDDSLWRINGGSTLPKEPEWLVPSPNPRYLHLERRARMLEKSPKAVPIAVESKKPKGIVLDL